ncbi:hypothetical protein PENTCL1PPCAC_13016, partial [Pristionchus entomophagus]
GAILAAMEVDAVAAPAVVATDAPADPAAAAAPVAEVYAQPPAEVPQNDQVGNLGSLPTRQYLDTTVVPILLQGLGAIAKERPADPIEFLANFLRSEKDKYEGAAQN